MREPRQFVLMLLLACLVLALPGVWAAELQPVPAYTSRVTDNTQSMAAEDIAQLESQIAAFEARKASQIALLIVPTTAPETIEQFSLRVAEAWKLDRKGVDDGVLVIVAKDDRTLRIEVGYGLEGALNDATARRIIDEIMVPHLRMGYVFNASQDGLRAIMRVIDGEALPPPAPAKAEDGHGIPPEEFPLYFLMLLALIITGVVVRKRFGRLITGTTCGLLAGGWTWFFTESIGATGGTLFLVLVGVALSDGSSGSGGSSGRSSSGGSSGGGGGSFGGGGSSGRW